MKNIAFIWVISLISFPLGATTEHPEALQREVHRLQQQSQQLQAQLDHLQQQLAKQPVDEKIKKQTIVKTKSPASTVIPKRIHSSAVSVQLPDNDPESLEFYPTALVADEHVVTYIAGTPVVTSPYLGSRPAFDGSDYIVNISSINRDIRLMQQRRRLYRAFDSVGYPAPQVPILALSGKVEPVATMGEPFNSNRVGDVNLGASELDLAAILNNNVEAYMSLVADMSPPDVGGQRLSNSSIDLNMAFVNIGNLDKTPIYFTAGQIFVPFGRFSTAMISAPLTMIMARTKARPVILGYKSKDDTGLFAAVYGFSSDTVAGSSSGIGGLNLGYIFNAGRLTGEVGASVISSIDDAGGMQFTASGPGTFGGFASAFNGSEAVHKVPAVGVHTTLNIDHYNFTAEWVSVTERFRTQDLSMNGRGAQPQALQLEAAATFRTFDKPASFALGYQWSKDTLALNLPEQRIAGVFSVSVWKDTVESLEYRHDINFAKNQYANGAAPTGLANMNTISPGGAADTVLARIGVYF